MQSSFGFFALALVVSLGGCASDKVTPSPSRQPVTLEIQRSDSTQPGFLTTYGSNGKMYIYRYSGGDGHHGNINVKHAEGPDVNIQLALNAGANFTMIDVPFTDDTSGQLTRQLEANGLRGHIHDRNSGTLDAYYAVKVRDSNPAEPGDVYCDPGIVNN